MLVVLKRRHMSHANSFTITGKSISLSLAAVHRDKCQTWRLSTMASALNQPPSVATCGSTTYVHAYVSMYLSVFIAYRWSGAFTSTECLDIYHYGAQKWISDRKTMKDGEIIPILNHHTYTHILMQVQYVTIQLQYVSCNVLYIGSIEKLL